MLLEEKQKICEVSEFSVLPYTQNRKLGNLGKCSHTPNFGSCCNLIFRNDQNKLRQKLCPVPKIEKSEILERILSLQIFTAVVTCSKFLFSRERVEPCFFVTFNIKSRLSGRFTEVPQVVQKIWRFSRLTSTTQFFEFPDTSLLQRN